MKFSLAKHGLVFSTRDRGERMRADLLRLAEGDPQIVIDFANVRSASNSFVDEFIGKLAQSVAPGVPEVINASPMIARTIERSLRRRGIAPDRVLAGLLV